MTTGRLTTLGAFALEIDGVTLTMPTIQKARAMLAFLALHRQTDVGRERLTEIFWPEADPQRSHDNLKTTLWAIRRSFRNCGLDPDDFISATRLVVRWSAPLWVDAEKFADAVTDGRDDAQTALNLYKGDFLEGVTDEWAVSERERLAVMYESLLSRSIERSPDVILAQRMIERNPYHEPAYAALIDAELAAERYVAATAVVERCRAALAEVGARPSSQFEARYGAIKAPARPAETTPTVRFVGREPELDAVDGVFARAANGSGSVLLLVGDAGIGKSSVLRQAHALAAARKLDVFSVRCVEDDAGAYGPWPRLYAQVSDDDFTRLVVNGATEAAVSCAAAISAATRGRGALVVDDVHALRAEGLAMFAIVARELSRLGHGVVGALRPEGLQSVHAALSGLPFDEVNVLPLDREQVDILIRQVIQEGAGTLAGPLYDRTQGHPLFIVGILDALARSGAIRHEARGWRLAQPVDVRSDLPPTLKRYVETRLRSRGDDAAGVACALALEPEASADDVAAALDIGETRTLDGLDDLLELGVVRQPSVGPQFEFCHDVFREVAATLFNAGRRARLHRIFAGRLLDSSASDRALRRARHLAAVGDHLSAAFAFEEASRDAIALAAWREAAERASRGLLLVDGIIGGPQREGLAGRLYQHAASAQVQLGNIDDGITAATAALEHARLSGDNRLHLDALLTRSWAHACSGGQALELGADAAEAAEIAERLEDRSMVSRAWRFASNSHRFHGRQAEAIATARRAYHAGVQAGDWDAASGSADVLLRAQITWWRFGDAAESVMLEQSAAHRAGRPAQMTFTYTRALLWYVLDRLEAARQELDTLARYAASGEQKRDARSLASFPDWHFESSIHYMRAVLASVDQRWDELIASAREAKRIAGPVASPLHKDAIAHALIDGLLGRAAPGDIDEAATLTSRPVAKQAAQSLFGWSHCSELSRARVAVALHGSDAPQLLDQALKAVEKNAVMTPLDADRAFERLAAAAAAAGYEAVRAKAHVHCEGYRARRRAAALEFSPGEEWKTAIESV